VQSVGSVFSLGPDIRGLAALATKLYGYVPPGEKIVEEIEASVKKLVGDAGWKGKDANEFQDAWGPTRATPRGSRCSPTTRRRS
jgi:hypothetical protein